MRAFGPCKLATSPNHYLVLAVQSTKSQPPCYSFEIQVGMLAASIPTIRHIFNSSRLSVLQYYRFPSKQHLKTSEKGPVDNAGERARLHPLTLNTMPSSIPSSFAYYQDRASDHCTGAEDVESQASSSNPMVDEHLPRGNALEPCYLVIKPLAIACSRRGAFRVSSFKIV